MNTPKWIEDKAENYLKENIDIEYNEGVCSTTDVGDGYIAGAMEVYQELEKWKNTAGWLYEQLMCETTNVETCDLDKDTLQVMKHYEQLKATER